MATHSSILAWKIPCTEEPGELQSPGSKRGRHDCAYMTLHHVGSLTCGLEGFFGWQVLTFQSSLG